MEIVSFELLTNRNGENIKESYDNLYLSTGCMVLGENYLLIKYDQQVIPRTYICILTTWDQHIIRLYQHNV